MQIPARAAPFCASRNAQPRRGENGDSMARLNLFLLIALVFCALSVVTSQHQARKRFVELQRAKAQAHVYDVEYGQLQLELSTWAAPGRIEKLSRENLRMERPTAARVEIVRGNAR